MQKISIGGLVEGKIAEEKSADFVTDIFVKKEYKK